MVFCYICLLNHVDSFGIPRKMENLILREKLLCTMLSRICGGSRGFSNRAGVISNYIGKRGLMSHIPRNPNRPTPLSIQTLKQYAESQNNMPVRLSLARFISSELPLRFAVSLLSFDEQRLLRLY